MKTKAYVTVSAFIFLLVAVIHLLRVLQGWPVEVGTWSIPLSLSVLAVLASAGVGIWGLTLLRKT